MRTCQNCTVQKVTNGDCVDNFVQRALVCAVVSDNTGFVALYMLMVLCNNVTAYGFGLDASNGREQVGSPMHRESCKRATMHSAGAPYSCAYGSSFSFCVKSTMHLKCYNQSLCSTSLMLPPMTQFLPCKALSLVLWFFNSNQMTRYVTSPNRIHVSGLYVSTAVFLKAVSSEGSF